MANVRVSAVVVASPPGMSRLPVHPSLTVSLFPWWWWWWSNDDGDYDTVLRGHFESWSWHVICSSCKHKWAWDPWWENSHLFLHSPPTLAVRWDSTEGIIQKAKKETRNWWGLRNVSGEYLSEANDVGCGRRGSESWGLARFEVRHIRGMKEGSLNQKLRLFLSDRSVIQVPFTCARFPCFLVNFSICVKEHFIREEGSSSDFKSNVKNSDQPDCFH